jgi:hypothetical protein
VLWDEVREPDYRRILSQGPLVKKAAQFVQGRIRDELMEEFVGCVGCDVVALEGEGGKWT